MNERKKLLEASHRHKWKKREAPPFFKECIIPHLGEKILDIGCGPTNSIDTFLEIDLRKEVVAFDTIREFLLDKDQESVQGNAERLPFKDNSFDTVLLIDVLEHLENDLNGVVEACRVSGKNVLITVPNHDEILQVYKLIYLPWMDRTHYRAYSKSDVIALLKKAELKRYKIYPLNKVRPFSLFEALLDKLKLKHPLFSFVFSFFKQFLKFMDLMTNNKNPFYITHLIIISL